MKLTKRTSWTTAMVSPTRSAPWPSAPAARCRTALPSKWSPRGAQPHAQLQRHRREHRSQVIRPARDVPETEGDRVRARGTEPKLPVIEDRDRLERVAVVERVCTPERLGDSCALAQ